MHFPEHQTPSAAVPPPAAAPAAGIASTPREAHLEMPAASFSCVPEGGLSEATRQHAIEPQQCRWILADEDAGADALMCAAPTEKRRSFCAAHCARVYEKPAPEEGETETEETKEPRKKEQEAAE